MTVMVYNRSATQKSDKNINENISKTSTRNIYVRELILWTKTINTNTVDLKLLNKIEAWMKQS